MSGFASYLAWFFGAGDAPPETTHHLTQQELTRRIKNLRPTTTRDTQTEFRPNDNTILCELHRFFIQHELGPEHEFEFLDEVVGEGEEAPEIIPDERTKVFVSGPDGTQGGTDDKFSGR